MKIDLADYGDESNGDAHRNAEITWGEVYALIRVARAAKAYRTAVEWGFETHNVNKRYSELGAALSDIEDSAHG